MNIFRHWPTELPLMAKPPHICSGALRTISTCYRHAVQAFYDEARRRASGKQVEEGADPTHGLSLPRSRDRRETCSGTGDRTNKATACCYLGQRICSYWRCEDGSIRNHPEKERALWNLSERASFEDGVAAERLSGDDVILKLNYGAYFSLLQKPAPESLDSILYELEQDRADCALCRRGLEHHQLGCHLVLQSAWRFSTTRA